MPPVAIACLTCLCRVAHESWTSVDVELAWLEMLRCGSRTTIPRFVVLESALGGLHGDNGAAAIGSAVGCRLDYERL